MFFLNHTHTPFSYLASLGLPQNTTPHRDDYIYLACIISYPARACVSRSYVIGAGVHLFIYVYVYICDPPKSLNGTLVVDSPFQTLAVDFSLNL